MLNKTFSIIFFFISVVAALIIIINKLEYSPDDTFIYLQYARNIAGGNGFSFNAGEPSFGITSPLWAILLAIPYLLGFEGYWFSKALDLLFAVLSVSLFFKLSGLTISKITGYNRENIKALQYLSAGIFLLNAWFLRWAFTGLETSLAVLIILTVFYAVFKERYYLSSLLAGLLFLIRPESVVMLILLLIYLLYKKDWKGAFISFLLYAILIVPWFVYAKFAFGTVVPNTALGKSTFSFGFNIFFEQIKRISGTIAFSDTIQFLLSIVFVIYVIVKRQAAGYLLIIFWILGLVTLYIITDADIISRYLLIMLPFFTLLSVQVLCVFLTRQRILAISISLIVLLQSQVLYYVYVQPHADNFTFGLKHCLIPIGNWLSSNTRHDSKILVNDVGAIGYYSNRYIIDAAALINRDLNLNKRIMETPVKVRENTAELLEFINADYLVQRDPSNEIKLDGNIKGKLEFIFSIEFPGLGISDPSPRFYKIYKVIRNRNVP